MEKTSNLVALVFISYVVLVNFACMKAANRAALASAAEAYIGCGACKRRLGLDVFDLL